MDAFLQRYSGITVPAYTLQYLAQYWMPWWLAPLPRCDSMRRFRGYQPLLPTMSGSWDSIHLPLEMRKMRGWTGCISFITCWNHFKPFGSCSYHGIDNGRPALKAPLVVLTHYWSIWLKRAKITHSVYTWEFQRVSGGLKWVYISNGRTSKRFGFNC